MAEIKKKILYLVTQAEWGGAQRYVLDLAMNLGDEFEIAVAIGIDGSSQELKEKILKYHNIKIFSFKHLRRPINPYHDLLAIFEIAKFLRQNRFDIIHLNSSKAGVLGCLAAQLASKHPKIFYTAHGWAFLEPLPFWRRWIYLWMEKIAAKLRQSTIVLSEKEKKNALKYKIAKKEFTYIIPNGIDFSQLNFLSREEARKILDIKDISALGGSNIVIGTIANLYKTKGLEYLIEAIKILNIQYSIFNIQAVIIGEGPERQKLESKILNLDLKNKIFLVGSVAEAYKYLKAFDIFILPSLKEGFPYTILEAMAAGLPIVATSVGAIPEILEHQKNSLIAPPGDFLALAETILNLINNPKKAERLGQNATLTVKKFPLNKMIEGTKIIYNELLK